MFGEHSQLIFILFFHQKLGPNYEVYGKIGMGKFTKVRFGVNTLTKEEVAVKSINKTRFETSFLLP